MRCLSKGEVGESPDAKRLDPMTQEERKENQAYWKARLGYNMRQVAEGGKSSRYSRDCSESM